jgi:hypothetical protein
VKGAKCGWDSLHGGQADSQTVYYQSSLSIRKLKKVVVRAKGTVLKTPSGLPSCPNTSYNEQKIYKFYKIFNTSQSEQTVSFF